MRKFESILRFFRGTCSTSTTETTWGSGIMLNCARTWVRERFFVSLNLVAPHTTAHHFLHQSIETMKFLYLASLLAAASAFTTSPSVISNVGEKSLNNVFADSSAHRTRRATIVMDGKANGKATIRFVPGFLYVVRTAPR